MSEVNKAFTKAIRLLARSAHYSKELAHKLLQKGFSKDEVEAAITECIKKGFLNDSEYLELFVKRLSQRGKSELQILAAGQRKQIASALLRPYFRNSNSAALEKLLVGKYKVLLEKATTPVRQKAFTQLIRRGFRLEDIQKALKSMQVTDN